MGSIGARIRQLEGRLPEVADGGCEDCIGIPDRIATYYVRTDGDGRLYSDSAMTIPTENRWPCKSCGFAPAKLHTIIVEYDDTTDGGERAA